VITRRAFVGSLAGGLLAAPRASEAQQVQAPKAAKIGLLLGGTSSSPVIYIEPFKQILREKGWIEGQNLTLVYRYAEGHYERLPVLVREILNLGIDVIVTEGTPPARVAMQATTTDPIVMAHPGGNLTGVSWFFSEINTKRLELLKEAAPHVARVAVVYNPLNPISEPAVLAMESAAKVLKFRIQRLAVRAPEDLDAMLLTMTKHKMDAVTVLEDPMANSQSRRVVDVALKGKVASVFGLSNFVAAGGFMSYGPSRPDMWRRAALLTDKILRGAKPGELPVEPIQ
jgi:putative ABC transport system substrate-binding protein